jgi:GntR family transcriptional regulator
MARYREIAAVLRDEIESGARPPGALLPAIGDLARRFDASRVTVRAALGVLEEAGLLRVVHGRGSEVVDRRPVPVRLSRYGAVMRPGGRLGPWETACAAAGVAGDMVMVAMERRPAPADVAAALGLAPGATVVQRDRHARIDGAAVQLHTAWYPLDVVAGTPLAAPGVVAGGVYGALAAAGVRLATADESPTARAATPEEAAELRLRAAAPVLVLDRLTRDVHGRAVELLRVVADPARSQLVYDGLPLG